MIINGKPSLQVNALKGEALNREIYFKSLLSINYKVRPPQKKKKNLNILTESFSYNAPNVWDTLCFHI